ncbi:Ger(x)C family spore germination protein [Ammoniphilus resinae]|uniref:Spore germination protein n=1 Tax=Ammoniphilus resinae TaxID=861532 RepID=A0ABS4GU52_9BACL|nr:Ger(x)C family spore germination protein [Ammoniphilus resinae]MBP1933788.1 spore germination protein [Ammoniphilus resinae]
MPKTLWKYSLLILVVFLGGCWDRVEIEERGFVVGAAVDFPKEGDEGNEMEEDAANKPHGKHRYLLTLQLVVPGSMSQGAKTGGGAGSGGDAYYNISSVGDTMFQTDRQLANRVSRSPFFPHMKILIISEEVARSGHLPDIMDFFLRDSEMRRGVKVMISKGEAREVLGVKPVNEKLPAMYIDSVTENERSSSATLPDPLRIGDLNEKLLTRESFIIPRIKSAGKEVKIGGVAVFEGEENKMVEWLGGEEVMGLAILKGTLKGGAININVGDNLVSYETKGDIKRKIKADISDKENMKFIFTIESEGIITESMETIDYLNDPAKWVLVQNRVADEMKRMAEKTIRKLQKEMKLDVIGLSTYLAQNYPELWKSVGKDWDHGENYFSKATLHVKARVIVRNPGTVNQTEPLQED